MTREQALALAKSLADALEPLRRELLDDDRGVYPAASVARRNLGALHKCVQRFGEIIAQHASAPTRVMAAEQAVVESAMAYAAEPARSGEQAHAAAVAFADVCARLRALRETAREEECGAEGAGPDRGYVSVREPSRLMKVRCHLPRGHEGQHEGDLGTWRWV